MPEQTKIVASEKGVIAAEHTGVCQRKDKIKECTVWFYLSAVHLF